MRAHTRTHGSNGHFLGKCGLAGVQVAHLILIFNQFLIWACSDNCPCLWIFLDAVTLVLLQASSLSSTISLHHQWLFITWSNQHRLYINHVWATLMYVSLSQSCVIPILIILWALCFCSILSKIMQIVWLYSFQLCLTLLHAPLSLAKSHCHMSNNFSRNLCILGLSYTENRW